MKQRTREYQQPSIRVTWAIGILVAPPEKFGAMMRQLAMRALHRRDPGNRLHDSAQCDLCLPAAKWFTPPPAASEKPQVTAVIKAAPMAAPAAKPVAPTEAAPPRISSPATHRPLEALASLLRSPNNSERQPQLSKEKGA